VEDGALRPLAATVGEEFDVCPVARVEHGHRLLLLGERQQVPKAQALRVEAQAPVEVRRLDGDVVDTAASQLRVVPASHVRPPDLDPARAASIGAIPGPTFGLFSTPRDYPNDPRSDNERTNALYADLAVAGFNSVIGGNGVGNKRANNLALEACAINELRLVLADSALRNAIDPLLPQRRPQRG
jgi:hypothetical protein